MVYAPDILIVDDEQVILAAARRILELDGLRVRTANDAETALEMMRLSTPAIVVIDLKLPGLSGLEFLERSKTAFPDTLVILMTGYATTAHAIGSLAGGAFDYLPKPFAFQELLSPVRRAARYLELDATLRNTAPESSGSPYYCLGHISWALKEPDGHYLLGPTLVFLKTVGRLKEVAMPDGNEIIHQGEPLAKVTAEDGYVHNLWVPLSGRVVAINTRLTAHPERADSSRPGDIWLARIAPADPSIELKALTTV